jgi:hypothetical protein
MAYPNPAVLVRSKFIVEGNTFNEEITDDMVFIAYQPTWTFDVPVYHEVKEYFISTFGDSPCGFDVDLYIFAIFKTMGECVSCVEKCGYNVEQFLPEEMETFESDIDKINQLFKINMDINEDDEYSENFMNSFTKLKVFNSLGDTPCDLIFKMNLNGCKPILKIAIDSVVDNQFGSSTGIDFQISLLRKYQQNDEADFSETKCTKDDLRIMLALKMVGVDIFNDYIGQIDSNMLEDAIKRYTSSRALLKSFEKRGFISPKHKREKKYHPY